MTDAFASINGRDVSSVRVYVEAGGPWYADVDVLDADALTGAVAITIGTLTLRGTVLDTSSGAFELQRGVRVVAGGGGWGRTVAAKAYHSDAGVKAQLVAEDAAREVGEVLGSFVPAAERIGADYARQAGLASAVLEDAAGRGVGWYVDYAGVTHVGARAATSGGAFQLLAFDPRERMATFQVDDPAAIVIGTPITDRLETPGVVRALEIRFQDHELRVLAWVGVGAVDRSKLAGLLNALARRALDGRVFGVYRYRVVRLAVDGRLELQAVRQLPGLPDLAPISVWPGVAGAHADLQLGTEVLVQFVEGDRAQPIVTGFAGLQGPGFSPATLTLGDEAGQPAARQGDAVEVLIPPAIFTGTIVVSGTPSPASGVVSWLIPKAEGVITAGSAKVKIA